MSSFLSRPLITIAFIFSVSILQGCLATAPVDTPASAKQPAAASSPPAKAKPAAAKANPGEKAKPSEKACGIVLDKARADLAQDYYVKGERLFADDDVQKAKEVLKTATCLDAKHKQAADLLQLLEQNYPGGSK